jgi:hypothetical protein
MPCNEFLKQWWKVNEENSFTVIIVHNYCVAGSYLIGEINEEFSMIP